MVTFSNELTLRRESDVSSFVEMSVPDNRLERVSYEQDAGAVQLRYVVIQVDLKSRIVSSLENGLPYVPER